MEVGREEQYAGVMSGFVHGLWVLCMVVGFGAACMMMVLFWAVVEEKPGFVWRWLVAKVQGQADRAEAVGLAEYERRRRR
jgi:hypothetical protein